MKEFKNLMIIGVDHGYGNIKTAGTVTKNGVTAYETEPIFSGNILEYGGMYYRIGDCHKEFIPDKAADEDYYLLTLMAVARELNLYGIREADVHLAGSALPLTWIRRQREEFRSYLLRNPEVTYRFNKKEYHIRLAGCMPVSPGIPCRCQPSQRFQRDKSSGRYRERYYEHFVYQQQKGRGEPLLDRKVRCQPVHDRSTKCSHGYLRCQDQ